MGFASFARALAHGFAFGGHENSQFARLANLLPRARACQRTGDNLFLRRRRPFSVIDHVIDRVRKFLHARARDDDGVTTSVRFLGDAKEPAAVVLAEFHVEALSFDLHLPRLDEIIHVPKKPRSLGRFAAKREAVFFSLNASVATELLITFFWVNQRRRGRLLAVCASLPNLFCSLKDARRAIKTGY